MITKAFNTFFSATTRISYRRLLCWGTGTGLLLVGRVDAETWLYLSLAFIAGEAAPKMMSALKGGNA